MSSNFVNLYLGKNDIFAHMSTFLPKKNENFVNLSRVHWLVSEKITCFVYHVLKNLKFRWLFAEKKRFSPAYREEKSWIPRIYLWKSYKFRQSHLIITNFLDRAWKIANFVGQLRKNREIIWSGAGKSKILSIRCGKISYLVYRSQKNHEFCL